ncbi:MAG: hypothetical protein ACLRWP_01230 [Bilophila wadsworthia]
MKPSQLGMPIKKAGIWRKDSVWNALVRFRKTAYGGHEHGAWEIAACGAIPALTASLDNQAEIIAIGNDESLATGIYARKDSPILGHTGYNALIPKWRARAARYAENHPVHRRLLRALYRAQVAGSPQPD